MGGPHLLAGGDDDGGALETEALGDGEADPLRGGRHDGHLPHEPPALDLHGWPSFELILPLCWWLFGRKKRALFCL